MECHSGGAVDIFIEPIMPKPQILILGDSIVARTLVRLARVLDYRVVLVSPDARPEDLPEADAVLRDLNEPFRSANTFAVVSTQGEGDAEMLRQALLLDLRYLAFVASSKKAHSLFDTLRKEGVEEAALSSIRVPAGLDIKARTSEEIAVSILAEIIQRLRSQEEVGDKQESAGGEVRILRIEGMTCQHCVSTVRTALQGLEGLHVLEVEIGRATVGLEEPLETGIIAAALESKGYRLLDE